MCYRTLCALFSTRDACQTLIKSVLLRARRGLDLAAQRPTGRADRACRPGVPTGGADAAATGKRACRGDDECETYAMLG